LYVTEIGNIASLYREFAMFRHILAPVDFSPLSALGLRYAGALARCSRARLTVLFADRYEPPPYFTAGRVAAFEAQFREWADEARAQLQDFIAGTLGETASGAEALVVEALPADAIRSAVESGGADLVVMGTHGRSGFNRLMLGSVAERVLRESRVPVLTVRGDTAAPVTIRRILCPVNDSPAARRALDTAMAMAACFDGAVTVAHVREAAAGGGIPDLCSWIPDAQRSRCEIQELDRGNAAEEIVALASRLPCDLLVMGAQHRRFGDTTVIGATTARVVRHAPCPVLTVVDAGAARHVTV
jgi:nucleotide-binding universal stress UspA family protein